MFAAAAFLAILDAVILSSAPDLTRTAFALAVSLVVGYAILMIWRSNSKLEKAADLEKGPSGRGKPPVGEGQRRSVNQ
jgi:hypothetical protein